MQLTFNSVEELRDFVKSHLKGTRGGKSAEDGDTGNAPGAGGAPAPLQPPAQGGPSFAAPQQQPSFQPPQSGQVAGFPGVGQPGVDPAVAAIVARINTRIDGAIASGQPADQVLTWFRGQCGPEAANATLDQVKQNFLPKLPMPTLEQIAKLMNA